MKRQLLNALAVLSLLLALATAALWVRSYWKADQVQYDSAMDAQLRSHSENFGSTLGTLFWHHYSDERRVKPSRPTTNPIKFRNFDAYDLNIRSWVLRDGRQWIGFGYLRRKTVTDGLRRDINAPDSLYMQRSDWAVFAPHWFVTLVLALAPAWRLVLKWGESRRRAPNKCSKCGYDLRATPDEDGVILERCPECGNVPKASPTAAVRVGRQRVLK